MSSWKTGKPIAAAERDAARRKVFRFLKVWVLKQKEQVVVVAFSRLSSVFSDL